MSKCQQVSYVKSFFEGPEGRNWCLKNNPEHCKQAHFVPLYLIEWQTAKKGLSLTQRQTAASTDIRLWKRTDVFILLNVYHIWNIDLDQMIHNNVPLCCGHCAIAKLPLRQIEGHQTLMSAAPLLCISVLALISISRPCRGDLNTHMYPDQNKPKSVTSLKADKH